MNDDLINRKWLMECVDEGWIKFDTEKDKNRYIHLVRDIAPSAQPEIIRCKDCKYYLEGSDGLKYCFKHDDDILWFDDDFCSRAERRTDE